MSPPKPIGCCDTRGFAFIISQSRKEIKRKAERNRKFISEKKKGGLKGMNKQRTKFGRETENARDCRRERTEQAQRAASKSKENLRHRESGIRVTAQQKH